MALVTLEEAKTYLRVDTADEDSLIQSLLDSAEKLVVQVSRLSLVEWTEVEVGVGESSEDVGNALSDSEITEYRSVMKTAIMYTMAYLYEHREEADHHELTLTLRSLLFAIREGRASA